LNRQLASRPEGGRNRKGYSLVKQFIVLIMGLGALAATPNPGSAQSYTQIPWEGSVSPDALRAGTDEDGSPLYLCVVTSWGGSHPGELTAAGECQVAWGGQGHSFDEGFAVVVGDPEGEWRVMEDGGIPAGAYPAGGDDSGPIYICRVDSWGGLHPGKLTEEAWCYVAHDGEEHYFTQDYEVLVE